MNKRLIYPGFWLILAFSLLIFVSGCFSCLRREKARDGTEKISLKGTGRQMARGGVNMALCWLELPHEMEEGIQENNSHGPFGLVSNAFHIAFGALRGAVWSVERCAGGAVEIAFSPFPPYDPIMHPAYPPYVKPEKIIEPKEDDSRIEKGLSSEDSCSTETSGLDYEEDSFIGIQGTHKKTMTRSIPWNGEDQICLSNMNGDIRISSWENPEISICAEKIMTVKGGKGHWQAWRSPPPFSSTEEAEEYFSKLTFKMTQDANCLRIETIHPRQNKKNVNLVMNFDVHVPRTAPLKITNTNGGIYVEGTESPINLSNTNGRIECHESSGDIKAKTCNGHILCAGAAGSIHAASVNGSITIEGSEDLSSSEAVECESVNGGITISLPEGSCFDLEAQTVNGGFQSDFPLEIKKMPFIGTIKSSVGQGGPRIKLESVNGSIKINKI